MSSPALKPIGQSPGGVYIVIPAYQEATVLGRVLESLLPLGAEIVVGDDGSDDGTYDVAARFPVHVLRHPINLGQGAILQTAIRYALGRGAKIIVTFDADGQHQPQDVEKLCEPIHAGRAEVVLGSRFLCGEHRNRVPLSRRLLLKVAIWLTRLSTGLPLTDTHNGMRAFTSACAERLRITQPRMAHASEILSQFSKMKVRVVEVPVEIHYTEYSRAKGQTLPNLINILLDLISR